MLLNTIKSSERVKSQDEEWLEKVFKERSEFRKQMSAIAIRNFDNEVKDSQTLPSSTNL
jgi:hypothetical protein